LESLRNTPEGTTNGTEKPEEEKAKAADGEVKPGDNVIALVDVPDWPLKKDAVGVVTGVDGDNYEVDFDDVKGIMSRTDFEALQEFEE